MKAAKLHALVIAISIATVVETPPSHPTQQASYTVSRDWMVSLSGLVNKSTTTLPVQIMRLPANMRPKITKEYLGRASNNTTSVIVVQSDGFVSLAAFDAAATYVSPDSVVFSLDEAAALALFDRPDSARRRRAEGADYPADTLLAVILWRLDEGAGHEKEHGSGANHYHHV